MATSDFAQKSGNGAERAAKAAVEKHRVLTAEKFRHPSFQFAMKISHSRKYRGAARAQAVRRQGFVRRRDHLGMIGQAEIIIGAEVDDGCGLPS